MRGMDKRKGVTEADCAALLDAAHQQLAGPIVVVWDYVARHIIPVVCPVMLCGQRRLVAGVAGGDRLDAAGAGHIMITARRAS